MYKLIKNITVEFNGKSLKVGVRKYGRNGTRAPITYIIEYNNRLITPFEQKIRGWNFTITSLFNLTYNMADFKHLLYMQNPILNVIKKSEDSFNGVSVPIPIRPKPST